MTFKDIYKTFTDFETKIKTPMLADHPALPEFLDDSKMFSNWNTIYNYISRHFSNRILRYEGVDLDNYLTNALTEALPILYLRQAQWIGNNFAMLSDLTKRGDISDKTETDTTGNTTNSNTNTTSNNAQTANAFGGDASKLQDTDKVAQKDRQQLEATLTQTANIVKNVTLTDNKYNVFKNLVEAATGRFAYGLNDLWKYLEPLFVQNEALTMEDEVLSPSGNGGIVDFYATMKTIVKAGTNVTIDFDDVRNTITFNSSGGGKPTENSFTYNLSASPDGQGYLIMKGDDIKQAGFSPIAFEFIINDAYLSQVAAGYLLPTIDNQTGRYTAELDIRDTDNGAPNTIALLGNIAFTINQNNGDIWMSPKAIYPVTFSWYAPIIGTIFQRTPVLETLPQTNTIPVYPYFKNNGNPTFYRTNAELNDIILATTDDFLGMVDVFTNPDGTKENKVFFWYEHENGIIHKVSSEKYQQILDTIEAELTTIKADIKTNTQDIGNLQISLSNIVNNTLPNKADKDLNNADQNRLFDKTSTPDARIIVTTNATGDVFMAAYHIDRTGTCYMSYSKNGNAIMRITPPSGNLPDGQFSAVFADGTQTKTLKEILNPPTNQTIWKPLTQGDAVWATNKYTYGYAGLIEVNKDYGINIQYIVDSTSSPIQGGDWDFVYRCRKDVSTSDLIWESNKLVEINGQYFNAKLKYVSKPTPQFTMEISNSNSSKIYTNDSLIVSIEVRG